MVFRLNVYFTTTLSPTRPCKPPPTSGNMGVTNINQDMGMMDGSDLRLFWGNSRWGHDNRL